MRHLSTDFKSVLLIIAFGLIVYVPYIISFNTDTSRKYSSGDSWWYMEMTRSMVNDIDLDMSNNIPACFHVNQSQLALSKDKYLAPKHGIFFPIATILFYIVFGNVGFVIFNLVFTILILIFMFRILRSFFDYNVSLITVLVYGFGSIIYLYSYDYLSDVFSMVIILTGIDFVLRRNYYTAALFLALSVFAKVTNILWITPVMLYMVYDIYMQKDGNFNLVIKELVQIAIIFIVSIAPIVISNYLLYGDVFTTGYQRIVSFTQDGNLLIESHTNDFNRPLLEGLNILLFHKSKGMLWDNYVLIPAFIGVFFIWKMKRKLALIMFLVIILMQFIFYSKYHLLLATEFGNRFLFLTIILSAVFTAQIINLLMNIRIRKR